MKQVTVRIYGPLNDFLPPRERQSDQHLMFADKTSVKDLIEGLGIPHPEIDLVLVNGESVPFERTVSDTDRVAAFPRFHGIDIRNVTRVRPRPPETIRFVLDGHLGKLARRLRLVGLDTTLPAGASDDQLAQVAEREERVLLTRDRELLKRRIVAYGYCVRETHPDRQLVEVLERFGPLGLAPFSRCLRCNAEVRDVMKSAVATLVPPQARDLYEHFQKCGGCGRVYWQGSHWKRLARVVDEALEWAGGETDRRRESSQPHP
jgi:uncharacterized protein with PIN domain/sulfur carrier protein ThiS